MSKVKVTYERESNLPDWATPEALKALNDGGKSLRELGEMAGVSYETIRLLIKKARGG